MTTTNTQVQSLIINELTKAQYESIQNPSANELYLITDEVINEEDVINALGYTPYDSSNPEGYTSNVGTVTSVNNVSPVNGNVTLSIPDISNLANKDLSNLSTTGNTKFQAPLVSGINIKTVNSNSLLGSGDIAVQPLITSSAMLSSDLVDDTNHTHKFATAAQLSQIATNTTNISTINGKIPAEATSTNKLADKAFVNSSIATNTANFIGTFNSVAELEAYTGTLTNNDYAFVATTDTAGNTLYDRYKYNAGTQEWMFEYELNNSSFTAAQWGSINSGITSSDVSLIGTALQPNDNVSELNNDAGYITGITSSDVTTALGFTPYNSTNPAGYITSSALSPYAKSADLATVATSGSYNDLSNKPTIPSEVTESTVSGWGFTKNTGTVTKVNNTSPDSNGNVTISIPAAQVNSDWNASSGVAQILNKPTIPTVVDTYSATGTDAISGKGVKAALDTLTIPTTTSSVTSGSTAALTSGGAYTNLVRRLSSSAATGGANQGVYIDANGQVQVCNATTSTYSATGTTAVNGTAVASALANSGFITGITSTDVTTALGYTPYSSANPNGYTSNVGTVTKVNNTSPDSSGNVTISIPSEVTESTVSGWGFTKNTGTVTSVNNVSPVNGNVTISVPTITDTYSATSSDGMSGKAVASAISNKADKATTLSGYGITDAYTKTEVDGMVASVYKPAGSVAFASLPTLAAGVLGNVYNVTDAFTTTSNFVEGAGKSYPAGTNVVVVDVGTSSSPSYKFDVLSGFVDLSGYVPTSRTINGKALTSNITLSASDVSALPSSTVIPTVVDTYSATGTDAISGKGVKAALDTLEILDYYGTCSTSASTQKKTVTCAGFVLKTGVSIRVKFTNAQSYNGQPTLDVNSTGAKNITLRGTTAGIRYMWQAGEVVDFTYDGTNWIWERGGMATTTYYGYTKLYAGATGTSTALALTPSSLNSFAQNMIEPYPVYSSSATYAVGDRVRYSYNAYECIVAITTEEAWNAEHWTQLPALQTQIDGKQATLVSGTNIKTVNGNSLLGSGNISVDSLPSQTGNSGKFLTTNGTTASWADTTKVTFRDWSVA